MKFEFKIETNSVQAASAIRRLIVSGELKPGMKLREVELSKSLGLSRSPIRESFRILESEGLVQITPNKGVSITKLKEKDLREIYELRALLESHGIRSACKHLSRQNLEELKVLTTEMETKIKSKDYDGYLEASNKFHELYMKNCNNERLFNLFKMLKNNISMIQIFARSYTEYGVDAFKEHKEIFEALLRKDPDRAERHLKSHLEFGYERVKKYLKMDETQELVGKEVDDQRRTVG